MNYIIDGFNLGHKIPAAERLLKDGQVEKAIPVILTHVQGQLQKSGQIIVVFDGQEHGNFHLPHISGLKVKFSRKPQTADDIIRDFVRKLLKPGQWTVISSDNEIIFTAQDMGAKTASATQFAQQSSRSGLKRREHSEKYHPQNVNVDEWLKLFNEGNSK